MRKILFLILFFITTAFSTLETKVYVCTGGGAKKYHLKENCRGLNACKHEIIETTKKQAQDFGLTLCGWED